MSTSGCSPRALLATARPMSTKQVRFAKTSFDAEGTPSSSRSSGSSSDFQGLCIKNTFIDVECGTPFCKRRPRTRTAPASQFCDETGHDLLSEVLNPQRDECSTSIQMRAAVSDEALSVPSRAWRPSTTEEMIARFNSQGTYAVLVKNTFIELEDESIPCRRGPRSKTELNGMLGCDLVQIPDEMSSDASTEDDSSEAVDESTEDQMAEPSSPFCSTPTPSCEAFPDQGLIFCQPQTVQLMQAPLPVLLPTLWPAAAPGGSPPAAGQALGAAEIPKRQEGQAEAAEEASRASEARPRREPAAGRRSRGACPPPRCLQQQALRYSEVDGFVRIQWTVDERKLRGSDKRLVSPSFDVDFGFGSSPMAFVAMLYPRSTTFRGSASFQQARGVGQVHLKCVSELGGDVPTTIRVSIGGDRNRLLRGPFTHSFAASPLFTLPREQAEWDFSAAVEEGSASFTVGVDVALT